MGIEAIGPFFLKTWFPPDRVLPTPTSVESEVVAVIDTYKFVFRRPGPSRAPLKGRVTSAWIGQSLGDGNLLRG